MKALNLSYEINSADHIKSELDYISNIDITKVCEIYSIEPDDVEWFIGLMKDDYETLFARENGYYINNRNEEYAQPYNFL